MAPETPEAGESNKATGATLSSPERLALSALSLLQAAVFAWAAWALPWQHQNLFTVLTAGLAVLHSATFALALLGNRHLFVCWKLTSLASLLVWLVITYLALTGGIYLVGLYGSLGAGFFAALVGIWGLAVLLTVPTACWGLVRTRSVPLTRRRGGRTLGLLALLFSLFGAFQAARASNSMTLASPLTDAQRALRPVAMSVARLPAPAASRAGADRGRSFDKPTRCRHPLTPTRVSLFVGFFSRRGPGFETRCVQAKSVDQALKAASKLLRSRARRAPVRIDLVTQIGTITTNLGLLEPVQLRPGLDGACGAGTCLLPWQLVASDAFHTHRPLDFLPDLRFGVSLSALSKRLHQAAAEPEATHALERIETQSFTISARGDVVALHRLHTSESEVAPHALQKAAAAAARHVLGAQQPNGKFRYTLHPFSGIAEEQQFNLPRQAGTTLVLCELGAQDDETSAAISRALEVLQHYERLDETRGLSGLDQRPKPKRLALSQAALPLVALLTCRERIGSRFDGAIGRLARFVLEMQREDGGFYPSYSLADHRGTVGLQPLYAPGQAILALIRLEQILTQQPIAGWPEPGDVAQALGRALDYVAHDHWSASLYPFFFIEENWHCLAARAALSSHRHLGYEQFCLDYVAFKGRLILDEGSRVDPSFYGGHGFGNVIPPNNAGTSGFGEALSAAIAIKRARGDAVDADLVALRRALGFLLRQQWNEDSCVPCDARAFGSLSQYLHVPVTRIDFAQHAWAALGHGLQVLAP